MDNKKITVSLKDKSYDIFIKGNILSQCGKYIKQLSIGKKILIVTQDKVPKKFINQTTKDLSKHGFNIFVLVLSSGEQNKNLTSLLTIISFAIKNKFERSDSFCALGGGVISDLTGFAASIYYRGINFICIPTTLLGMVDAAVGGKTAINIPDGKNLLGTFYQPKTILIDPNCLKTLPKKEFLVGMGEVLKYALLEKTARNPYSKSGFFYFLKTNKNNILKLKTKSLLQIITHSVSIKAYIVSKDERESGLRAILNLGHTFAHGIEQAYNYKKYTHGEAVSIGMCLASKLAQNHKLLSESLVTSIINLISSYSLPTKITELSKLNKITQSMLHDKKIKDGKLRFILPHKEIGKVKIISGIPIDEVKSLIKKEVT
ncbi:MAG: 3-dehydroquinate synthase [Candidatus Melainabacteria bacterium]|nr:3-dehydroquinate synthase [Candidatus Melainabacteria bacterium]